MENVLNEVYIIGSFKGLHFGHTDMIQHYSKLSDHVIVYITDPKKAKRETESGKYISGKVAKEVLRLTLERMNLRNVSIIISNCPYNEVVEDMEEKGKSAIPYLITLGCSNKGNDLEVRKKFNGTSYCAEFENITYVDPAEYVFDAYDNISIPVSATMIRKNITNKTFIKNIMPQVLTGDDIDYIYNLYNTEFNENTTHLEHLEDILITSQNPVEELTEVLNEMMYYLTSENSQLAVSRKYDGTSLIVGKDISGNKLVANKGLFNKNPKYASTVDECDIFKPVELQNKMKLVLSKINHLHINKNELIRGDLLYTKDSVKKIKIDGKEYVSFQPNIIRYCIPKTIGGKPNYDYVKILTSEFGVAWHTHYYGRRPNCLFESPLTEDRVFKENSETFDLFASRYCLNRQNLKFDFKIEFLNKVKNEILEELATIRYTTENLEMLSIHKKELQKYINTKIKSGTDYFGTADLVNLIYTSEFKFPKEYWIFINQLLSAVYLIGRFKELYINILNNYSADEIKMYYELKNGERIESTGEGYVINYKNHNYKLVKRLEFSRYNFSDNVKRGWEK